jgi:GT2 family glycosyltransferase
MSDTCVPLVLVRDTPDLAAAMRRQLPGVRVIDNGSVRPIKDAWLRLDENRYFSGGWNAAVQAVDEEAAYDWVWLLNSDVTNASELMMTTLVDTALEIAVPVISPAVRNSVWPIMQSRWIRRDTFVDFVAPVVNVRWFIASGGFDTNLPGWGSDIDLCYRTAQDDKAVNGHLEVQHPYGTTSRRLGDRTMYDINATRSYLTKKHGPAIIDFLPHYFGRAARG